MTQSPHWLETPAPSVAPHYDPALLAAVLAASRDCILVLDLDGTTLFINETGRKLMELGHGEGLHWPKLWPGAESDAAAALEGTQAGGKGRFTATRESSSGNRRVWDVDITPVPGADGQPQRFLAMACDVTEQQRVREALLEQNFEHHHSIKNQMAVAQSIVNQTLRGAYAPETAKRMIAARLDVLARTHDLLMHSQGEGAPISALVAVGTRMLDARRIKADGPDFAIGPKAALSLALILHELAVNAASHGAFSKPEGEVQIQWGLAELDGEPALELSFTESGGPLVVPPSIRGFGSRLLQGGLSGCASQAWLDFHPQGLQFRLLANLAGAQGES